MEKKSNGLGTAGMICAIIGAVFCWVPVLNWILLTLGLVFSLIGVFKKNAKKGTAIAGLIISGVFWIVVIILAVAVAGVGAAAVASM